MEGLYQELRLSLQNVSLTVRLSIPYKVLAIFSKKKYNVVNLSVMGGQKDKRFHRW
jgi:hypothetical protein